jgi:hypothetical protein
VGKRSTIAVVRGSEASLPITADGLEGYPDSPDFEERDCRSPGRHA